MTEEGSTDLGFVLKLPQMFYISTLSSTATTLLLLAFCVCRSVRQSIQNQFSSIASDEESWNSNSTDNISIKDNSSEKEPTEKDLFVINSIKHPKM